MSTVGDFASSAFTTAATGIATTADLAAIPFGGLAATSKAAGTLMLKIGIATGNIDLQVAGNRELAKSEFAEQAELEAEMTALNMAKMKMKSFGELIKSIAEKV